MRRKKKICRSGRMSRTYCVWRENVPAHQRRANNYQEGFIF